MNSASPANTIVFEMTTSTAYRRYRKIASAVAPGIPTRSTTTRIDHKTSSTPLSPSGPTAPAMIKDRNRIKPATPTSMSHLSCCRSSPRARRKRTTSETIEAAAATTTQALPMSKNRKRSGSMNEKPNGLSKWYRSRSP